MNWAVPDGTQPMVGMFLYFLRLKPEAMMFIVPTGTSVLNLYIK